MTIIVSCMQTRTQKLLVMVGEEGAEFDNRDYRKLTEVIVGEYLAEPNPTYRSYLGDILIKVIRGVPLKTHFYAALAADISRVSPQITNKVFEGTMVALQNDLSQGSFPQAINSLNFLAECMNISLFNSLTLVNILEDILNSLERESQLTLKQSLLSVILRALPLCSASLNEKVYHDFRKLFERIHKLAGNDPLCEHLYVQFQANNLKNRSVMSNIQRDFNGLTQFQSKMKLHLDFKEIKNKTLSKVEIYKLDITGEQDYVKYCKEEGTVNQSVFQLIVECFQMNSQLLKSKLLNWIRTLKSEHSLRHIITYITLRGLRSKKGLLQAVLLASLCNQQALPQALKHAQQAFSGIFASAESFELSVMINYAKICSSVLANVKQQFQWISFVQGQASFVKRAALLKLVLQKISLLNDKFVFPPLLQAYEPTKPVTNQQQYSNTEQMQIFQQFENALKAKTDAQQILKLITSQKHYSIFLQALFCRTSQSQTHLNVLQQRYHSVLTHFGEYDWDLINKIRNFFKNSFFHRLLYLRFMISKGTLSFASYVNYVGQLRNKSDTEMIWVKMELHELNGQFGKTLKKDK